MIGQDNLRSHLRKLTDEDSFPKFVMLVGMRGQGKRTLTKEISNMLDSSIYEPDNLKVDNVREMIEDAQSLYKKRIYLIADAGTMTTQAQNALLKFAEEPTERAHIIMTVEHESDVLETIKSRATSYQLERYRNEHLRQFTSDEVLLSICTNIGQIKRFEGFEQVYSLIDLSEKVIENIGIVSTANAFNILKHVDMDNADLFLDTLLYSIGQRSLSLYRKEAYSHLIVVIYKYKNLIRYKSINKQNALEMMFVEMREVIKSN